MNQGRIWCVVKPTVGLPIFLSAVALTSLAVHTAVLSNTTWFADFFAGRTLGSGAAASVTMKGTSPVVLKTEDGKAAFAINVTPAAGDSSAVVIKVDRLPGDLALAGPPTTVK